MGRFVADRTGHHILCEAILLAEPPCKSWVPCPRPRRERTESRFYRYGRCHRLLHQTAVGTLPIPACISQPQHPPQSHWSLRPTSAVSQPLTHDPLHLDQVLGSVEAPRLESRKHKEWLSLGSGGSGLLLPGNCILSLMGNGRHPTLTHGQQRTPIGCLHTPLCSRWALTASAMSSLAHTQAKLHHFLTPFPPPSSPAAGRPVGRTWVVATVTGCGSRLSGCRLTPRWWGCLKPLGSSTGYFLLMHTSKLWSGKWHWELSPWIGEDSSAS